MSRNTSRSAAPPLLLPARLAWSDLWHEKSLSICSILGLAAVIAPLLILFGLKTGSIETLRRRLVDNPANREIIPQNNGRFTNEWLNEMRLNPAVAFVIPTTRKFSLQVQVGLKGSSESKVLDLLPTGAGDPEIAANVEPKGPIELGEGDCVISYSAADVLKAKAGDMLTLEVLKNPDGVSESVLVDFRLAGVTSLQGADLDVIYAPLRFVDAVEQYKDGFEVPSYHWKGKPSVLEPLFDGVVFTLRKSIPPAEAKSIAKAAGFSDARSLTPAEAGQILDRGLPNDTHLCLFENGGNPVKQASIDAAKHALGEAMIGCFRYVRPLSVQLIRQQDKAIVSVKLKSLDTTLQDAKGVVKASNLKGLALGPSGRLFTSHSKPGAAAAQTRLVLAGVQGPIEIPVEMEGAATLENLGTLVIPAELAGLMNAVQVRPAIYDAASGTFELLRTEYASFRLYARSIDQVDDLRRSLEDMAIKCITKAQRINDVQSMDRNLTLLFWIIAIVGVGGSAVALAASMHASTERKMRSIGILRLIGISGPRLLLFPICEAVALASLGFAAGWGIYQLIAVLINSLFSGKLQAGEKLCHIPLDLSAHALALVVIISAVSSLFAGVKILRFEVSDAIRDE